MKQIESVKESAYLGDLIRQPSPAGEIFTPKAGHQSLTLIYHAACHPTT